MNWTDATSYSKNSERIQTAWELKTPSIRICISNNHRCYPGVWVMYCHHLAIAEKQVGSIDNLTVNQAQDRAIELVRMRLNKMQMELNNVTI